MIYGLPCGHHLTILSGFVPTHPGKHPGSKPTVKQHLAAIRMLFDWLVTGQVVPFNPATSVRGPKHVVERARSFTRAAQINKDLALDLDATEVTSETECIEELFRFVGGLFQRLAHMFKRGEQ